MSPPIPTLAGTTSNAALFHQCFATLSSKTKEGLAARTSSWSQADPNGNSYISLAEIDAFLLETLKVDHGDDKGAALHQEYRPAYLLAFNRSKNLAPTHQATANTTSDDYLTKKEFRLFFVNLIFHVLALDCFAIIDGGGAGVDANDDRRITPQELEDAASKSIAEYGFVGLKDAKDAAGAADVFAKMDANGGGIVLLDEFCKYLIAKEIEGKTDIGKEMDVDLSKAPTPAKTKKKGGVPHFMSPITPTADKAKPPTGGTRSAAKATSTPSTSAKKPVRRPPTSAAKSKSKPASTTPQSTSKPKAGTKAKTAPTPTPTKIKKKTTVADPSAPKFRKPGPSADLRLFQSTFEPLIDLKDSHAKKDRAAAWKNADPNGNGMLSLAEVDSWIQTALVAKHRQLKGKQLYKLYRPVYILAFDAAKSLAEGGNDDYVTKKEFRLMIAYLNLYADLLDAFAAIDGGGPGVDANDDRRISRDEWMKGHHSVSTYDWTKLHKITDAEAAAVFDQMDADNGGMVLLNEWCDYLIRAEVRVGSDTGKLLSKIPKYSSVEDEFEAPSQDNSAAEREAAAEAKRLEDERVAQEKAAAEAKQLEEQRIAAMEKAAADKAEAERIEQERIAAEEKAEADRFEQERLENERLEQLAAEVAAEKERLENERLEQERIEQERLAAEVAAEKERLENERLEQERIEQERLAAEVAAEKERLENERLEQERIEQERLAAEAAAEKERLENERLEQERIEQERLAAEKERLENERLEQERIEQERLAAEATAEKERLENERLEQERIEQERLAAEAAKAARLEEQRIAEEKAAAERLEQERIEQERATALEQERLVAEAAAEKERIEQERATALEQERLAAEAAAEKERLEKERVEQERLAAEEAELKTLKEEEARIAAEEAELKALEEEEARIAAEEQAAKEAEILRQKELEAQRLNEEIQQEQAATTEAPVSSLASSLQRAAPFASSLRAAAGSSLAAAAKKASSLAEEVKKEMNGE